VIDKAKVMSASVSLAHFSVFLRLLYPISVIKLFLFREYIIRKKKEQYYVKKRMCQTDFSALHLSRAV